MTKAQELKKIADQVNIPKHEQKAQSMYHAIIHDLEREAKLGNYKYRSSQLDMFNNSEVWLRIVELLKQDGYRVEIKNEITAQYSNTDWDSADFLIVDWS